MKRVCNGILATALSLAAAGAFAQASTTLTGTVRDFVPGPLVPGFSNPDDKGEWSGIDVDYCRGIAAAVFGDPSKSKYVALSSKDRFPALQSGEVDATHPLRPVAMLGVVDARDEIFVSGEHDDDQQRRRQREIDEPQHLGHQLRSRRRQ